MTKSSQTSVLDNSLIWFGAAVSIAEILTGTYFAELGLTQGLLAIVIGHLIGCSFLFLSGLIGAQTKKSAMESAKLSFGSLGAKFFAVLNVIQLLGWTSIMIFQGSLAANKLISIGMPLWCLAIGMLILIWVFIGVKRLGLLNKFAMSALLVLCIFLGFIVIGSGEVHPVQSTGLSFGAALELSIAMPLSWLPLISDYSSKAEKPFAATLASCAVYGITSCAMYIIGMCSVLFSGSLELSEIILAAGFGLGGIVIVVFSTVTTTFLDAYSAGVSSVTINHKLSGRYVALAVTVIGTVAAIFFSPEDISEFLYFIGSVFAPMIAIQVADFYLIKKDVSTKLISTQNFVIWLVGFLLYRFLMGLDLIVGATVIDVLVTIALCFALHIVIQKRSASR